MYDLRGKTAFVTGASSGLGAHFAQVLADAGAAVVIAARRLPALSAVADRIRAGGGTCETIALDVADPASVTAAAVRIGACDIVVNNAGIVRESAFIDHSVDDWDAVIDANVKGMFLVTQAAARGMKARGAGSIINIASITGLRQGGGIVSYAVSKAAVIQLTKVSALELARFGIRVNALAPGYIATDLNAAFWQSDAGERMLRRIPQRRLGQPAELNGPLLLLASDQSSYMNGSVIAVDGGHLVSTL